MVRLLTQSIKSVLFNLVVQMSIHHSFQFGITLGFSLLNRIPDIHGDLLFELIRCLELPEVQIIRGLFIWLLLHRDCGFVSLRVESLHSVALSSLSGGRRCLELYRQYR